MSKTSSVGSAESAITGPTALRKMQHESATETETETEIEMKSQDNADYPNAIELLRQRSQRLATRLQQTQREMTSPKLPPNGAVADRPLIEQRANQFMLSFVSQHQLQQPYPIPMPHPHQLRLQQNMPRDWNTNPALMPMQQMQLQPDDPQQQLEKKKRKSRSTLSGEVDALKELVFKVSALSPYVQACAKEFVRQNEVLAQLDWKWHMAPRPAMFGPPDMTRGQPHPRRQPPMPSQNLPAAQRPPGGIQRTRRDSELSSTSSSSTAAAAGAGAGVGVGVAAGQSNEKSSERKRNRNRKRINGKNTPHSMKTELEAMRAYINRIVQQHVGGEQLLPPDLSFKGDFGDLEAHARRLVAAGYGRIVEEEIRVNRKNNRQAFITMSTDREALERDGIVLLPVARRYAFEGDTVRAFVLNVGAAVNRAADSAAAGGIIGGKTSISLADDEELSEETESQDSDEEDNVAVIASDNCPKAFVIAIVKQTELRQIVGNISFTNASTLGGEELFYKFRPFDLRMPMAYVSHSSCLAHIRGRQPDEVCGLLYVAHILETDSNGHCIAELLQPVGRVGNLDDELKAILVHNSLRDVAPFEERFNEMYAQPAPPVSRGDLLVRRDLRQSCVFTIDPLTARDLDDALSIEQLAENVFEVGVHISDVSHYLEENSELDNIVKERSTSIYLANEVIHMLPQTLCFRCSLLPGEDKYSFSVFWRMDAEGNQLREPQFTRSVINSCTQFAYEHAQKIIDNPHERFTDVDFPSILNGFTANDIVRRVTWLNGIASQLRRRRFDNGALTINNAKLRFSLDPISGEPTGFELEKQREANHMIEEFMLLANQAVARFIHGAYPSIAVLRNHPPPLTKSLKALREKLLAQGYDLDYSSSKALQASMQRLCREAADPHAMSACLSQLLMKPMARATYFCSEGKTEPSDLWHYALSIPIYTHFTSPIRRYPDVMVHRLLAAGLKYCPAPARTPEELHQLTKLANERKYNAKQAGDDSSNLLFKRYVRNRQAIYMHAVVMEIFQHMMNVVTLESGHVIAINYKMQRVLIDTHNAPNFVLVAERNMKHTPYKLHLLSVVPIRLIIWDGKLTGFLLTADQRLKGPSTEPARDSKQQLLPARNSNKVAKNVPLRNDALHQQRQQHQQEQQRRQQQQQRMFALRGHSSEAH